MRKITITLVFALVAIGLIFHTGTGTLSSLGYEEISTICPLGILEVFLAEKTLLPRALVVLLLIVGITVVLGKVFCSWVCPIPPLRRIFAFKSRKRIARKTESVAHEIAEEDTVESALANVEPNGHVEAGATEGALASVEPNGDKDGSAAEGEDTAGGTSANAETCTPSTCSSACSSCVKKRAKLDSRHVVLGGALLSTAVFGFPVFCLICPVGLCFATIIAFWRWVGFDELTLSLLVFPAILAIEIFVVRKWCLRFCPLGAVFSLMSLPNRFLRPKVDESVCLRNKGIDCNICVEVCEEKLDPHSKAGMHECSKCGECVSHCPAKAITLPFNTPKKNTRGGTEIKSTPSAPTTPLDSTS
ncbi:MAG: 4Fe-4S binding protein [Coriobacteriales bacterium]|nr:4Fe-4S binding protein [Coriobacteriales bacterium]